MKKVTEKKRPAKPKATAEAAPKAPKSTRPRREKTVVQKIREEVEKKLSKGVEKASLADYIRLVQLEKELTETEPKETKATWIDPQQVGEKEKSDSGK